MRLATLAVLAAATTLVGCGSDAEEPATTEPAAETQAATAPEGATTSADAGPMRECMLTPRPDRAVYESVDPSSPIPEAAAEAGGDVAGLAAAGEGMVYLFMMPDHATAEEQQENLGAAVSEVHAEFTADTPDLGPPSIQTVGPVAIGVIPVSEQGARRLVETTVDDVEGCLEELPEYEAGRLAP